MFGKSDIQELKKDIRTIQNDVNSIKRNNNSQQYRGRNFQGNQNGGGNPRYQQENFQRNKNTGNFQINQALYKRGQNENFGNRGEVSEKSENQQMSGARVNPRQK